MDTRERWRVDPDWSTLEFSIRHAALGEIRGQFDCWGGEVLLDRADPRRSAVRIWVDMSSIDTGSAERDEHILATELFDLHWEPALVFDSEQVEVAGADGGVVVGSLALHSFRKRIAVAFAAAAPSHDDDGTPRFACTARASIRRAELGLRRSGHIGDWLAEQLLDENIQISAHLEAARADRAAARAPQAGSSA